LLLGEGDADGHSKNRSQDRDSDPQFASHDRLLSVRQRNTDSVRPAVHLYDTRGMWERCGGGLAIRARPGATIGRPAATSLPRFPRTLDGEGRVNVSQQRILIVEDDARIADLISKNLGAAGYECHQSADGGRALADFARLKPALIVLDLGLAGVDGLEVTRRVRKESDVPILMVTARSSESDKLLGLEIGADDYITKPFSTAELTARVRALLRRSSGTLAERTLEVGTLRIDPSRRTVERDREPITVTTLEFDLLYFLASRPGRVFSREALMEQVWGTDRVVGDRSIDSLVSRLRRKLESDPAEPRYIQTVWGAGYRFAETAA